ncbi:hypothetical protein SAMN05216354_0355 [Xylanibacter ruminicola]|uniref:Uncharacterized protein n=1 Tax=Xylanibacter ruminicola TaxID=839 RepID=A0A1H5RVA1_XYLRU|nr:hypothetical protein [Xylanibacter ruminicola]SEF42256.1 hypothetical protein SAMN05216354_0355 [Xylanibacter ruminicola]
MTVYEAIHQMRLLTAKGQSFAMSFMSYSLQRHESHGEVTVEHAQLIKNEKTTEDDPRNFMLKFRDQDTGEAKHFWQPLLMSMNHQPIDRID